MASMHKLRLNKQLHHGKQPSTRLSVNLRKTNPLLQQGMEIHGRITKTESKSLPNQLTMDIKMSTLNLCLGLQAKKNLAKELIISKNQWNYREKFQV